MLEATGGGSVEQNAQERGGSEGLQNLYLEHFVFMNWLIGAFDLPVQSCCQHIFLYTQTHHFDMLHMVLHIQPPEAFSGI